MKSFSTLLLLLALLPFAFAAEESDSASGADPSAAAKILDERGIKLSDPLKPVLEKLDRAMLPYARIHAAPESGSNPKLSPNPFLFWRIGYSKRYDAEPIDQPSETSAVLPKFNPKELPRERNHATVLIVPVEAFPIENAVVLRKPEELEAEDMRPFFFSKFGFLWRKIQSQYEKQTLYLGSDGEFHFFADGDLAVLDRILTSLELKGGINPSYLLASGLIVKDEYNYTCRYAIMRLAEIKDPNAVRAIRSSIRHSADLEEYPFPQFTALSLMSIPEAHQEVNEGTESSNRFIRIAAATALARRAEPDASFKEGYFNMISTRTCLAPAIQSAIALDFSKEILPMLEEIARTPRNAEEFMLAAQAIWTIRNPGKTPLHGQAAENIRAMLMRSGDLLGTARYQSVDEREERARQTELAKLDQERIRPYYDFLVQSPDADLSIIAAVDLALFQTSDKRLAELHADAYLKRINDVGVSLLRDLPRDKTLETLRNLIRNNESPTEKKRLDDILRSVRNSPRKR